MADRRVANTLDSVPDHHSPKEKQNTTMPQSLIITLQKKGNIQLCQNYRDNIGEWFRTTTGVHQGCLLSPTLFNILERITADALEDHEGTLSIGGRTIANLRFVDDIDGLGGQEQELVKLVNHLEKVSTAYGMQINAEKTHDDN